MNYNKVILGGRLTANPDLKNLPNGGDLVCEFRIATNRTWKDPKNGEKKEDACFIDAVCYGKRAQFVNDYFEKGSGILVEGRLKHDVWQDKSGGTRSKHRIVVENVHFADTRPRGETVDLSQEQPATTPPAPGPLVPSPMGSASPVASPAVASSAVASSAVASPLPSSGPAGAPVASAPAPAASAAPAPVVGLPALFASVPAAVAAPTAAPTGSVEPVDPVPSGPPEPPREPASLVARRRRERERAMVAAGAASANTVTDDIPF